MLGFGRYRYGSMSKKRQDAVADLGQKADALRRLAAGTKDRDTKEQLLKVAAGFKEMARSQGAVDDAHLRLKWPKGARPKPS